MLRHMKFRSATSSSARAQIALLASLSATSAVAVGNTSGVSGKTYSFVLSNVFVASNPDDKLCPSLSKSAEQLFRESLPEPQRTELADAGKGRELSRLMHKTLGFKGGPSGKRPIGDVTSPNFTPAELDALRAKYGIPKGKGHLGYIGTMFTYNHCTDPEDFPLLATGIAPYMGSVAYGIDLDGKVSRDDFVAPDGTRGVDNAMIAAVGCDRTTRDYGNPEVASKAITSLSSPVLMEISGVDDPVNDAEVTVRFYASASRLELDGTGKPLAMASLDIDPDARYHSEVKARIKDGLLVSDTFDLRMRFREVIIDAYREILRARVRFKFSPDKPIDGGIYGYHTIASLAEQNAQAGTVGSDFHSCGSTMRALRAKADYRDPRTGRMTAISSALQFHGVPAFLIPPTKPSLAKAGE